MNNIISNKEYNNYIIATYDAKITFEEKRSKYMLDNKNKRMVYKLFIDNGIIKTGIKCDNGIYYEYENKESIEKFLYLIELKGIDIEHAFNQLVETYKWFKKNVSKTNCLSYKIRIVCTRVCKNIQIEQGKKKFIKYNIRDIIVKERIIDTIK